MMCAGRVSLAVVMLCLALGCSRSKESPAPAPAPAATAAAEVREPTEAGGDDRAGERARMVEEQLAARDVRDPRVLAAMRAVPRHELVPEGQRHLAYENHPLPIGHRQTISQPYIVAKMTELADIAEGERCLEIGTGSGYQSAVLAELGCEVYTIEIIEPLGRRAAKDLERLGYEGRVRTRIGDGYRGWPEAAPFDAILVTAAPPEIPKPLKAQLAEGGFMVIPVGDSSQDLRVLTRRDGAIEERKIFPVRFVPMTGEARDKAQK